MLRAVDLVRVHGRGRGAVRALDGVSVAIERGGLVAVMGASGSGKSTLLHCLAGLDRPTGGSVLWDGEDVTRLPERRLTRLRRGRIGMVFQDYDLLPQLTVRQNVVLPVEIAGARVDREWLATVLSTLGLVAVQGHRPGELSGGQQQRVAVARAMALRPDVVLADEPTGALDAGTAGDLLGFLRSCVADLGQTVVMATHDPLAAEWADRALLLHEGRVAGEVQAPTAHGVLDALAQLRRVPQEPGPARRRRRA
ncbi:MAG: ABC transporter ATP-binding protein [Pseudonocardiales bacterium]|nr:ABC transporter ATP-binding protein [Pseudonocardiales bacterium]